MKKKLIVLMLSMSMTAALVSGCGSTAETAVESTATETVQENCRQKRRPLTQNLTRKPQTK